MKSVIVIKTTDCSVLFIYLYYNMANKKTGLNEHNRVFDRYRKF